jgi:hypothetical protein
MASYLPCDLSDSDSDSGADLSDSGLDSRTSSLTLPPSQPESLEP